MQEQKMKYLLDLFANLKTVQKKPYFQPDFLNKTTLVAKRQIKDQPY
jgi:hypothetical protein